MQTQPPQTSLDGSPTRSTPDELGAPRRARGRGRLRLALVVVVALLVIAAAVVAWEIRRFSTIPRVEVAAVQAAPDGQPSNWLLVGTDSRDGIDPSDPNAGAFLGEPVEGTRTDTILVVRVDQASGTVDLLSVPRDLWVTVAERGDQGRINGAFNSGQSGNPNRLAATVESALGIEINHYMEVDFVGFRKVVDALGGVTMTFEHPTRDLRSGLVIDQPGEWHLDGDQALALARSRTYEEQIDGTWRLDPTGDLGRTERQRRLLAQIVAASGKTASATGLIKADRVLAAGADSVVLDQHTDLRGLLSLVRTVAAVGPEGVTSHALPVVDHRTSGGAQVLLLQEGEAEVVLASFRPHP